jgi:transcriptional regulator with XRE-family HTH domain
MARTKRKNTELAIAIGKVIRERRKAAAMTQAALAEAIGLESETVSRLENGIRLPSIEKLVEIAEVFGVPVAEFFRDAGVSARQQDNELFAEKINIAVDKLPEAGKIFVLEVAQTYARYHLVKRRNAPRKS